MQNAGPASNGGDGMTVNGQAEIEAELAHRERLFRAIGQGIEYVFETYGGFTAGGGRLDTAAWRSAPMPDLLQAIMTYLRSIQER
jgi:hypothetical protein